MSNDSFEHKPYSFSTSVKWEYSFSNIGDVVEKSGPAIQATSVGHFPLLYIH